MNDNFICYECKELFDISLEKLIGDFQFCPRCFNSLSPDDAAIEEVKPIWEQIEELMADVPPEEFDKLPTDLSINLDHYLYGAPKEITRAEALRISRETIETAERERGELADREAAAGIQYDAPIEAR